MNVAEAGFYDVAYSLVEIACVPAQAVIKFGGEGGSSGTNGLAIDDNPVGLYRVTQKKRDPCI